jgi:hypothetical protein
MAATSWTTLPSASKNPTATGAAAIPDYFGTAQNSPEQIIRLAKIPGADPSIYQQFQDANTLRDTINTHLGTYFDALSKSQPSYDTAAQQDQTELSNLFSPQGYQSDLSGIRARRTAALSNLGQYLFGDLRRSLSMGRVGGAGGAGLSSYLARMAAGEAGKIQANQLLDSTTQQRTDLASLMAARQGSVGKSSTLLDSSLNRLLSPIDVSAKANSVYANAIQQAIQQALLNSMMGVGAQKTQ